MSNLPIQILLLGVITGSATLLAQAAPQVSGEWLIDIRTVCAVGAVVMGGAYQISRWQQRVVDRLERVEKEIERLSSQQTGALLSLIETSRIKTTSL